jgi:hypothetical protein
MVLLMFIIYLPFADEITKTPTLSARVRNKLKYIYP